MSDDAGLDEMVSLANSQLIQQQDVSLQSPTRTLTPAVKSEESVTMSTSTDCPASSTDSNNFVVLPISVKRYALFLDDQLDDDI